MSLIEIACFSVKYEIRRDTHLVERLLLTGYRPHELGIFQETHQGIDVIKRALKEKLLSLIEEGLQWVIIGGQQGVEWWASDVVFELQAEYPIQLAIIMPFLEPHSRWQESKQQQFELLLSQADFVDATSRHPYQAPWQFIERDKFVVNHTDGALLVYDDEQVGGTQYIKKLIEEFKLQHDYPLWQITAFDLQEVAEQIEQEKWYDTF